MRTSVIRKLWVSRVVKSQKWRRTIPAALTCLGLCTMTTFSGVAAASVRPRLAERVNGAGTNLVPLLKCLPRFAPAPMAYPCLASPITHEIALAASPRQVSRNFFELALARGAAVASGDNTDLRETVVLTSVGAGEILKVHSAYNMAKGIEATTTTVDVGLLRFDTPAVRSIDSSSIVVAPYLYFRPASSTGKWSGVRLAPNTSPVVPPGQQLLRLIGSAPIVVTGSSRAGTTYSVTFTTNDLGLLTR